MGKRRKRDKMGKMREIGKMSEVEEMEEMGGEREHAGTWRTGQEREQQYLAAVRLVGR